MNDSTYQIDIAGDLVLDGENPYGHDYRGTGLERWYPAAGEGGRRQVALDHFAYFPGTVLTAAAWRLLPTPFDDYSLFVLLATLALLPAALLLPARSQRGSQSERRWRPIRSRSRRCGSGQPTRRASCASSSPSRSRCAALGLGRGRLGVAVLLKQFALVALPFLAVMFIVRGGSRATAVRAGAAFGGVLLAAALPFLIADPGALWDDTIAYGAGTYRIVGYGLSALLVEPG